MESTLAKRQGRIQFKHGASIVFGYFPATFEQKVKDWLRDDCAHFECGDERTLEEVQFKWSEYHLDHYAEMQYKAWRPTDYGAYMKDFVANVLKAKTLSFRDFKQDFKPNAVH